MSLPAPHSFTCLFKRKCLSLAWSLSRNRLEWPWRPGDLGPASLCVHCVEITSVPPHLEFEVLSCYMQGKNFTNWASSPLPFYLSITLRISQIMPFWPLLALPPQPLCYCYTELAHCCRSCFAVHRSARFLEKGMSGACYKHTQRQLQKQSNVKRRDKRQHAGLSCGAITRVRYKF